MISLVPASPPGPEVPVRSDGEPEVQVLLHTEVLGSAKGEQENSDMVRTSTGHTGGWELVGLVRIYMECGIVVRRQGLPIIDQ